MYEARYIACVDKVTRPDSGTCMDLFFVVKSNQVKEVNAITVQSEITDHFTTCLF